MIVRTLVKRALYQDSLALMRVAQELRTRPGVIEAAALMGTPGNLEMLAAAGLATPESESVGPGDLVLAVGANDAASADAALAASESLFVARDLGRAAAAEEARPRGHDRALARLPGAGLATISVPGDYARLEAMRALKRGLHVFLFSDNVPIEDELALKRYAVGRGLLCMGPDCGTAYLGGLAVGFANVVPRGPIGLVAASGTGMQAIASTVANLGAGVSQGIGVGGRDLSAEIGGLMTLEALDRLERDPQTKVVVLVSKPPAASVMPKLAAALDAMTKPVVVCALGAAPQRGREGVRWVADLESAAQAAVATLRGSPFRERAFSSASEMRALLAGCDARGAVADRSILGLYTGGTLASEAALILAPLVGEVDDALPGEGAGRHHVVDLGDDRFTAGVPHPMLAPETRAARLAAAAADAAIGVVLLDCVLGRVAHRDPTSALVTAIDAARAAAAGRGQAIHFVASVTGTAADPQSRETQAERLRAAGVIVCDSNSQAARFAALLVRPALRPALLEAP